MKNKKTVIIIISIMVTYLILSIVLFGWNNLKNKFQTINIMLSTGDKISLKDGNWIDIKDEKEYNWNKFDIYVENNFFGNYNLLYNDKWYIFDNNRNSIKYDGRILGINGNIKYDVINFTEESFDNIGTNSLKKILDDNEIDYPKEFTYAKKSTLDIDGDEKDETIYTVSNAFTYESGLNKKFSIVFIENNDIDILYEDYVSSKDQYDLCVPKINSIIDINKDSKYEIILECNYFSVMGTCTSLYEPENGKYKLGKGCKEE